MDGNTFDSGAPTPMPPPPPPQAAPPPQAQPAQAQPAQAPPGPTNQFPGSQQPPVAPANATAGKPGGGSKLLKVLLGLAVLSFASVVILVGAVVVANSIGLFDSDGAETSASAQLDQPEAGTGANGDEDDGSQQPTTVVPITPEGVTIAWDASPSSCDGNNKRSFSANIGNTTPGALEVRVRILDLANNFVHQSHVYTVPASDQIQADLGGIPSGQSIVQIIDESNDEAIGQTSVNFESC